LVGWSRTVASGGGRRLIVSWSRSGSFNRCFDRGYDSEDRLRIGGRHLRVVVRRPAERLSSPRPS
jgi:hypothetical protein